MFLSMIKDDQKGLFLDLAVLVSISDDPIFWDGKSEEEVTGETDLTKVSLRTSATEVAILEDFAKECGEAPGYISTATDPADVFLAIALPFQSQREPRRAGVRMWNALYSKLKELPLHKQNNADERIKAVSAIMEDLISDVGLLPAASKVMLYELMLLALADGKVSDVEESILLKLSNILGVDDFVYDDLMERARSMNHEVSKSLSLILE